MYVCSAIICMKNFTWKKPRHTNMSYTHTNVEQHKYHMILGFCFVTTHDMSIQPFKNEMQYYLQSIIRVVTFIMDKREQWRTYVEAKPGHGPPSPRNFSLYAC